jgi:hypothetical protein
MSLRYTCLLLLTSGFPLEESVKVCLENQSLRLETLRVSLPFFNINNNHDFVNWLPFLSDTVQLSEP